MNDLIKSRTYKVNDGKKKTVIKVTDVLEVDNSNIEQRIRAIIHMKNMDISEISKQFGTCNEHRFIGRCRTGKFRFSEQRKIAELLGVDIVIQMMIGNYQIEAETVKDMVLEACKIQNKSISELSKEIGTTRQALSRKLECGKFTHDEMVKLADHFGGKYHNYFIVNGYKI